MSKNKKLLDDFVKHCEEHPEYRFWQALRNWSESSHIFMGEIDLMTFEPIDLKDTFYFEEKKK